MCRFVHCILLSEDSLLNNHGIPDYINESNRSEASLKNRFPQFQAGSLQPQIMIVRK